MGVAQPVLVLGRTESPHRRPEVGALVLPQSPTFSRRAEPPSM